MQVPLRSRFFLAGAPALLAFSASAAWAVTIWSYDNSVQPNQLIKFDSASPESVTVVGSSGVGGPRFFSGLDFDGAGNLYGYTLSQVPVSPALLYSVNQLTGAATAIGASGLIFGEQVLDMSWNPKTSQMQLLTRDVSNTRLNTVDLATGQATPIGVVTGLPSNAIGIGLATDAAGVNYVHDIQSNSMYVLSGLSATLLGPEGFDSSFNQGMTIDWSRDGTWYHGAVRTELGNFSELYTVNPTSGAGTLVGAIGPGPLPLSPGDLAIQPVIPEPSSVALFGLGGLIACGALRRTRIFT